MSVQCGCSQYCRTDSEPCSTGPGGAVIRHHVCRPHYRHYSHTVDRIYSKGECGVSPPEFIFVFLVIFITATQLIVFIQQVSQLCYLVQIVFDFDGRILVLIVLVPSQFMFCFDFE